MTTPTTSSPPPAAGPASGTARRPPAIRAARAPRTGATAFPSVRSEGALLPPELLARIAAGSGDGGGRARGSALPGLDAAAYHLLPGERPIEAASRAWSRLRDAWAAFEVARATLPADDPGTAITRERWLLPLFDALGYGRLQRAPSRELAGRSFAISHQWGHLPIHLVGCHVDLDSRRDGLAGAARSSPHGLVQELLNHADDHLWGVVSNGLVLRLLRDNHALTRQAYLEFDLEEMLGDELFADFALLWHVLHQSRVEAESPAACWLERWSQQAAEQGTRAREALRRGVERAIETLGQGFLDHPANRALRARLDDRALAPLDLYRQLLRLVYRLLFLFVAEDRDLLAAPPPEPAADADDRSADATSWATARERYQRFFSTQHLRALAGRRRGGTHGDLWHALRLVTRLLGDAGSPALALPALGSFLFSADATPDLDAAELSNAALLDAVRHLAFLEEGRVLRPVDYRNLGPEELGSVYESLLEQHPEIDGGSFRLATAAGHERKTTGSYYTPSSLIACLLDTALDPVLAPRVEEARRRASASASASAGDDPAAPILALRVVDPACGSGHFLIAAAHRIAHAVARARTGDEEPAPEAVRHALRDTIGHCLYGVDLNPMAVELCKINLWLEALEPGRPLSFLDHHLRVGNSLLGTTPALLARGIPDAAFEPLTGDDKPTASRWKKQNKKERADRAHGQARFAFDAPPWERLGNLATAMADLDHAADDDLAQVRAKERRFADLLASADYRSGQLLADAWCAAFVWPKHDAVPDAITEDRFRRLERNPADAPAWMLDEVRRLATDYQFFHWHLAFPEVFRAKREARADEEDATGWEGGFDVVLGNPPWDRVKLQEKEFFAGIAPEIATAPNAAARGKLIRELVDRDPALWEAFQAALRRADGESHFVRQSGRYPLGGRGDVNTYVLFAELNRSMIAAGGRVGCIVPSGIATDDTTKSLFQHFVDTGSLSSLYDFQSGPGLFVEIGHATFKFCLLTLRSSVRATGVRAQQSSNETGAGSLPGGQSAQFAFFLRATEHLAEPERRFSLAPGDFALLNPNTRTCPTFRSRRDAEITKAIYRRVPVLIDENDPEHGNPWGIRFLRLLDMSNDSGLFRAAECLTADGWHLDGNHFTRDIDRYVPLYEAKMVHHYDHRFGDYADQPDGSENTALPDVPADRLANPTYQPLPRYWVPAAEVEARLAERWSRAWLLGWRDITKTQNERTVIASVIPRVGVGNKFPLILTDRPELAHFLLANLSSFALDYAARQKLGGTTLNYFILKQLPVLPPSAALGPCPWSPGETIGNWVKSRVLELTYAAHDLAPFARDLGYPGPPFPWNPDRRHHLRCELDAAFFHLYGLSHADSAYILDTFPIVRDNEEKTYGTYRTKHLILDLFDSLSAPART